MNGVRSLTAQASPSFSEPSSPKAAGLEFVPFGCLRLSAITEESGRSPVNLTMQSSHSTTHCQPQQVSARSVPQLHPVAATRGKPGTLLFVHFIDKG
jgi:hypothetical protein